MMADGLVVNRSLDKEDGGITIDADDLGAHQLNTVSSAL